MKHVLAILLLVSGSAFAADNGSEYQWQTPADKWEVTPMFTYRTSTEKPKTGKEDKTSGFVLSVMGEYGISEMFSAGLKLAHQSYTDNSTPEVKYTGLQDLQAFFHGRSAMGSGSLRYGVDIGFGLEKSKQKSNTEYNASSGGMSLRPFVGYEMTADHCLFGARLSYQMFMGDRTHENLAPTAESKITGPTTTTLALFYEHHMQPMILGAALEIAGRSKTETKMGTGAVNKGDAATDMGLKVYVPYEVSETIVILPELKYAMGTAHKHTVDSSSELDFAVGARFAF